MNKPNDLDATPAGDQVIVELQINGAARRLACNPAERLSDSLRDRLNLTGTKIGCHAGDCGACTVIVDGQAACACLIATGQLEQAQVITIEGMKDPSLRQAFIDCGATQCGICTPGMLMAAHALLASNPNPSVEQVQEGIGGVLCRCTGYRAIIDAVMLAAQRIGAESTTVPAAPPHAQPTLARADSTTAPVGRRVERLEAAAKLSGAERFGADFAPAGALWLRTIRSPYPHAKIELSDLSAFKRAHPQVLDVLTSADVPNNRFSIFPDMRDQPVLAERVARYRGEAVIALVGERDALWSIAPEQLPVRFVELPAALEIDQAIAAAHAGRPLHANRPDNVLCRGRVVRGDVDAALAGACHAVAANARTSYVEHAYIEPEAGYAEPLAPARTGDPVRVRIVACTQTPYMDRDEVAYVLGCRPDQVRISPSAIGGGFGGKLDVSIQPLLAIAALKLNRPVRTVWDRPESMSASTKRHPARMTARAACDAQGRLTGFDFSADFNTGAYASWGPTVANRVPIHACGPYRVPAVRALTRAVLTHNAIGGAFRGFGVPQATILTEALIDELAERCGLDKLEFRLRNALVAGDTTATGQRLDASVGLQACLRALQPAWRQANQHAQQFNAAQAAGALRRGAGIACMWYGIGNTVIANPSTMTIGLRANGRFMLYNGAQEIGQGSYTIMAQIAAQALGVDLALIDQLHGDTDWTEDAGKSSASRQTFVSGNAARLAAVDLRTRLLERLAAPGDAQLQLRGTRLSALGSDAAPIGRSIELAGLAVDARGDVASGRGSFNPPTVPLDADGQGVPYATYAFAAQIAEVEVDVELGTVKVLHIHAAHDVGRAINPTLTEGQIVGGIAQGLGMALMEEYVSGKTDNLHDYLIPTAGDVPPVTIHLIEDPEPLGPYGAKGVGEPALIATAPAILNAIHAACGVRIEQLPATPARLRAALLSRDDSESRSV